MTKEEVLAIKQGDRVVYTIGGVEYNATALSTAHYGYNHGVRLHSAFLNLIYLNEQGTPIKIFGAPILGSEVDDHHLIDSADDAIRRNPVYHSSDNQDKKDLFDAKLDELKSNPRTIGWRIGSVGDRPAPTDVVVTKSLASSLDVADNTVYPALPDGGATNTVVGLAEVERNRRKLKTMSDEGVTPSSSDFGPDTPFSPTAEEVALRKSSGQDGEAGDWTQTADQTASQNDSAEYPA